MSRPIKRLTEDQEHEACEMAAAGDSVLDICLKFGFITMWSFSAYKKKYPEFKDNFETARCDFIEEYLLRIPLEHNPKTAEVLSKNAMAVLKYKNRHRYGDQMNLDVSVAVDIAGSLDRAEARLVGQTVSNVVSITAAKAKIDE